MTRTRSIRRSIARASSLRVEALETRELLSMASGARLPVAPAGSFLVHRLEALEASGSAWATQRLQAIQGAIAEMHETGVPNRPGLVTTLSHRAQPRWGNKGVGEPLGLLGPGRLKAHPSLIVRPVAAPPDPSGNGAGSFGQPGGNGGRGGSGGGGGSSGPYGPVQIRTAYGIDPITFTASNGNVVRGDGTNQTIAIVDAYNDPNVATDLAFFSHYFYNNDPYPVNLAVVDQNGNSIDPTSTTVPSNASWAGEISLDVEWAHVVAPGAKILLVEANSSSYGDLLAAVDTAKSMANVVSMSWGGGEFPGETGTTFDGHFVQPGVTFVASSGDTGGVVEWPAVSPNVMAVGGTSLQINGDNTWRSESGWSGSGGGVSSYEARPTYQNLGYSRRAVPDVAYNGDPNTGFYVYDTYQEPGWVVVGGTSAGAPQWSALVAIANQGRALAGKGPLDGLGATLPAVYQTLAGGDLHDITSGRAGRNRAGAGFDLITGEGTPLANLVVQDLVTKVG